LDEIFTTQIDHIKFSLVGNIFDKNASSSKSYFKNSGASAVAATTDGRLLRRKGRKEEEELPLFLFPGGTVLSLCCENRRRLRLLSLSLHASSPNNQPSDLVIDLMQEN
jgi:hypothetical protein